MYNNRIFVGLLMLGLLLVAEPVMAQEWGGGQPQAPTVYKCSKRTKTVNSVDMESQACVERLSEEMVKGWAVSAYTDDNGMPSLYHNATVKMFRGATLLDEAFQEKFASSGIACPTVTVDEFAFVTVKGTHLYQVNVSPYQDTPDNTSVGE